MRVGISTACFYPHINTEDTLEVIKALGFDICEVFLESEYEMTYDFCKKLKEKAEKLELNIYSIHPFSASFEPFLFDRYSRRRVEMENRFRMVCNAGSILGADCYVFHGLRKTNEKVDILEISKNMDNLMDIAENYKVKIAWENVAWCRTSEPDFTKEVLENMDKKVYFNLDIKQAIRSRHFPYDYIKLYKERIINVHINDGNDRSTCLLPGEGNINLNEIVMHVEAFNKKAPFIIEVYSENYSELEDIKKARKYVESLR